jgi:hypothetical protein
VSISSGERERLNLSLGPDVKETVQFLARYLGMTESQLVVHALLMSLPELHKQASVVATLNSTKHDKI